MKLDKLFWANSRQRKRKFEDPGCENQDANLDGTSQIRIECSNIDPGIQSRAFVNDPLPSKLNVQFLDDPNRGSIHERSMTKSDLLLD